MKDKLAALLKSETKERTEAIRKLEGFLLNPGRFSVLVLGMRGTGKSHWINEIQKCNSSDKHLKGLVVVNAALAKIVIKNIGKKNLNRRIRSCLL